MTILITFVYLQERVQPSLIWTQACLNSNQKFKNDTQITNTYQFFENTIPSTKFCGLKWNPKWIVRRSNVLQKVRSINSKMVIILRFSKRTLKADNLIEGPTIQAYNFRAKFLTEAFNNKSINRRNVITTSST